VLSSAAGSRSRFGRLEQRLGDLSVEHYFAAQLEVLRSADLIFVDGPKDRRFEPRFTRLLRNELEGSGKIVVFDDIRLLNMVRFWDRIDLGKFDATSLGHWSGTGIIQL
jgi:hypothetical protein